MVVLAIFVVGWRWPSVRRRPDLGRWAPALCGRAGDAAVLFLCFWTLTLLAYCLVFGGITEVTKKFIAAILNRAGIGATLGLK